MTQAQDLEHVYAELRHHLDDVLPVETINTMIIMLKQYPKLKELSEIQSKTIDDLKIIENMARDVGNTNDRLNQSNKVKNEVINEIKKLSTHAGCMGNTQCVLCPIYNKIIELDKELELISHGKQKVNDVK